MTTCRSIIHLSTLRTVRNLIIRSEHFFCWFSSIVNDFKILQINHDCCFSLLVFLGSIFKSRDITLPTKVRLVKAMGFPVVMYGCESWTVTKAERRRIDAFELWCWIRLLRVPWSARRSNQSFLKISPGISLEGMMLKLKLHLMRIVDSLEKTLMLGGMGARGQGDDRGWHHWLDGCESEWTPGVGDGQGGLVCCDSWGGKKLDTTEQLIWSDLIWMKTSTLRIGNHSII